jgi:uncharacterized protein YjlB
VVGSVGEDKQKLLGVPQASDPRPRVEDRIVKRPGLAAAGKVLIDLFNGRHEIGCQSSLFVEDRYKEIVAGSELLSEFLQRPEHVLVLPAGTGHRNLRSSDDLLVVGAYPDGMRWDLRRGDPAEHDQAVAKIQAVPLPSADPVEGPNGSLTELWRA